MLRHSTCLRSTALACVVLTGHLLLPGLATAEPAPPPKAPTVLDTARVVAARHASELGTVRAARSQGTDPDLQSGSFFKSPAGVAVLVAFGVGVGYALYSASNDRIKSPGR